MASAEPSDAVKAGRFRYDGSMTSGLRISLSLVSGLWLSGCGILIPDTEASGEWTAVAVIVGLALAAAVGVAVYQAGKERGDQ